MTEDQLRHVSKILRHRDELARLMQEPLITEITLSAGWWVGPGLAPHRLKMTEAVKAAQATAEQFVRGVAEDILRYLDAELEAAGVRKAGGEASPNGR